VSRLPTEDLIERLASDAGPVKPLAAPLRRGMLAVAIAASAALIVIAVAGNVPGMRARYAGRELLMAAETGAMLATAVIAILAAFMVSVPGRTKLWLFAPLPTFALWFAFSGIGCLMGSAGPELDHSTDCLAFITVSSLVVGLPLLWRLSRARPIEPVPVALMGGLGAAALSAFLLQFFHPFALSPIDLAVHFGAVLLVLGIAVLARRVTLAPA